LFERRRDLFSDLSLVFMDTTSLAFCGAGGDSLGAHGHSKDHRPDLKQMILAVVIDGEGRPICTEMLPGNTADMIVLLPVVDRLRERFHIGRVCVVADRGMISAATIAALEERKLEYILGARERSSTVIRRLVLDDEQPLTRLLVERVRGETQLFVKEVKVGTARYILCRNAAEAERDRSERQAIVAGLAKQLARGDKALIGNSASRRYLRRTPGASGKPGPAFEIDPGKLADEARYDGLFVLRTNARITPLQAVLRYRDLRLPRHPDGCRRRQRHDPVRRGACRLSICSGTTVSDATRACKTLCGAAGSVQGPKPSEHLIVPPGMILRLVSARDPHKFSGNIFR
jgi:hypothetical protein